MKKKMYRGSITVESILLCPVLILLVLFVVYVGRLTDASIRVHRAADVSARVASQANLGSMIPRGFSAAHSDMAMKHSACSNVKVTLTKGRIGRILTVTSTVSCTVQGSGLGMLSLPAKTVHATSTEVVDFFTAR